MGRSLKKHAVEAYMSVESATLLRAVRGSNERRVGYVAVVSQRTRSHTVDD